MCSSDPELKTLPSGVPCVSFNIAYKPPTRRDGIAAEKPPEWCAAMLCVAGIGARVTVRVGSSEGQSEIWVEVRLILITVEGRVGGWGCGQGFM